jgi:hypothetical protein
MTVDLILIGQTLSTRKGRPTHIQITQGKNGNALELGFPVQYHQARQGDHTRHKLIVGFNLQFLEADVLNSS